MAKGLLGLDDLDPERAALLAFGFGLMGTRGSKGFSDAGKYALATEEAVRRRRLEESESEQVRQMRDLQMQQIKAAMAEQQRQQQEMMAYQQAARNNMMGPAGMAMMGGGGPTVQNAQTMSQLPPNARAFNEQGFVNEAMGINPLKGLEMQQQMAARNKPIPVSKDTRLVNPTDYKEVLPAVQEPNDEWVQISPTLQQNKKDGRIQPIGHAPAPSVNLQVNTEKSLYGTMADTVAKQIAAQRDAATDAINTIDTAHTIKKALDSGKAVVGPPFGQKRFQLAQLGSAMGITGPEATTQTRAVIQGLSKLALSGRGQLKGQGQISDFESKLLIKAESGDFDNMTEEEIRGLADVAEKSARLQIKRNRTNAQLLAGDKSGGAAPLTPFFDVQEPPQYVSPKWTNNQGPADLNRGLKYLEEVRGGR